MWRIVVVIGWLVLELNARSFDTFFDAIAAVESCRGVHQDNPNHLGPYQISYGYWVDSGIEGSWRDVVDEEYAERVMFAYFERYAPNALDKEDFRTLARIHNGGPDGARDPETLLYWTLVERSMRDDTSKRCD